MSTTVDIPTCNICGKTFKNNQGLEYHKTHFVCQKFSCVYCGHRFKSSLGLKYHTDRRICLPPKKIPVTIITKNHYHIYTIPREDLKIRDMMSSLDGNFGEMLFNSENIITKFIELALSNPHNDHYWSCYISNRRDPYITVYNGDSWKLCPQTTEFHELGRWALDKIAKYLKDNKAIIKRDYWSKYYIAKDQFERKSHQIHKQIKHGLFCLFVNQKQMIMDKSRETGLKLKP
jgi:hypothetical protein